MSTAAAQTPAEQHSTKVTSEYVVLARGTTQLAEGVGVDPPPAAAKVWIEVGRLVARSPDDAIKSVLANASGTSGAGPHVAVAVRYWNPRKPKIEQPPPVITFEDAA